MKDLEDLELGDIDCREVVINGKTFEVDVQLACINSYNSWYKTLPLKSRRLTKTILYSYYEWGKLSSEKDEDGNIVATYEYKHADDIFDPVKEIKRNSKGDIVSVKIHKYDSDNETLKKTTFLEYDDDGLGKEYWCSYSYNKDGKLKRKDYFNDDGLYRSYTYTYDSKGKLKREEDDTGSYTEYNSDGYEIHSHIGFSDVGYLDYWFEYLPLGKDQMLGYEFLQC
jgi:YD repeat-containing protein